MADDLLITPGIGPSIAAADDVGGKLHQRIKLTLGPDGTGVDAVAGLGVSGTDTQRVVIATDQTWGTSKLSANFNRPADTTPYSINDSVSDNVVAGSVTELQWALPTGAGVIRRVRVKKSDQTVATATFRLWLYDAAFAAAVGDNAAFNQLATNCIGYVDIPVTTAGTDDAVGWTNFEIAVVGASIYGQLQTLSAFTPGNQETFTVDLWVLAG
jgi:hypothetical protein